VAQNAIVDALMRAGLPLFDPAVHTPRDLTIRDNRRQVVRGRPLRDTASARGRNLPLNVPDVSYMGSDGHRVNVEVDTTAASLRRHMSRLIRRDPAARHVGILVDPRTGRPMGQWVYQPRPGRRGPVRLQYVPGGLALPAPRRPAQARDQRPAPPAVMLGLAPPRTPARRRRQGVAP
jgi:hypothetical protein